jgi:hypothetical protein
MQKDTDISGGGYLSCTPFCCGCPILWAVTLFLTDEAYGVDYSNVVNFHPLTPAKANFAFIG